MGKILIIVGLVVACVVCIVLFFCFRGGSNTTTAGSSKPATTTHRLASFRHDLKDEVRRARPATDIAAMTGPIAENRIAELQEEDRRDELATTKEVHRRMCQVEIQRIQTKLAKLEREVKELPHTISYQENEIAWMEHFIRTLGRMLGGTSDPGEREITSGNIAAHEKTLTGQKKHLEELRMELLKKSAEVARLHQWLKSPEITIVRTDDGSEVVERHEE